MNLKTHTSSTLNQLEINTTDWEIMVNKYKNELEPFIDLNKTQLWQDNPFKDAYQCDYCKNCSNNPINNRFASGFCNCVLPYLNNIIY